MPPSCRCPFSDFERAILLGLPTREKANSVGAMTPLPTNLGWEGAEFSERLSNACRRQNRSWHGYRYDLPVVGLR